MAGDEIKTKYCEVVVIEVIIDTEAVLDRWERV